MPQSKLAQLKRKISDTQLSRTGPLVLVNLSSGSGCSKSLCSWLTFMMVHMSRKRLEQETTHKCNVDTLKASPQNGQIYKENSDQIFQTIMLDVIYVTRSPCDISTTFPMCTGINHDSLLFWVLDSHPAPMWTYQSRLLKVGQRNARFTWRCHSIIQESRFQLWSGFSGVLPSPSPSKTRVE